MTIETHGKGYAYEAGRSFQGVHQLCKESRWDAAL